MDWRFGHMRWDDPVSGAVDWTELGSRIRSTATEAVRLTLANTADEGQEPSPLERPVVAELKES